MSTAWSNSPVAISDMHQQACGVVTATKYIACWFPMKAALKRSQEAWKYLSTRLICAGVHISTSSMSVWFVLLPDHSFNLAINYSGLPVWNRRLGYNLPSWDPKQECFTTATYSAYHVNICPSWRAACSGVQWSLQSSAGGSASSSDVWRAFNGRWDWSVHVCVKYLWFQKSKENQWRLNSSSVIVSWWDMGCKWVTGLFWWWEKMLNATDHMTVIRNKINRLTILRREQKMLPMLTSDCAFCNSGVNW